MDTIVKAEYYEKNNDFKNALNIYFNIIRFNPNEPFVLNKIGMCFFNLENFEMAIKNFEKILPLLKQPIPDLLNNIGCLLYSSSLDTSAIYSKLIFTFDIS